MMSRCAEDDELLRLIDGELTENDADRVREHLLACGVCRARSGDLEKTLERIKMPVQDVDTASLIEDVMRALPAAMVAAPVARARSRAARWTLLGGFAAVLAASAFVAVPFVLRAPDGESGVLLARGRNARASMARLVGVRINRVTDAPLSLTPGARVRSDDGFAVVYRNLGQAPVYLLAFAVDARREVHWICPTYVDPASDPMAVRLLPETPGETHLPPPIQFEGPASGPMRFVAILSSYPMKVSSVETLQGAELEPAALRARWSDADVRELTQVIVDSSPEVP